jgi:hypothetical protein
MNFMETPAPGLEENGKMNESQITIAVAFLTELSTYPWSSSFGAPWCPPYEYVPPFLSRQTRTTVPVEMHCRHEEGTLKPITCSRPSTHDLP